MSSFKKKASKSTIFEVIHVLKWREHAVDSKDWLTDNALKKQTQRPNPNLGPHTS